MNLVQFELLMQRDNEKVKKVQQRNRRSLMKLQLLFATVIAVVQQLVQSVIDLKISP